MSTGGFKTDYFLLLNAVSESDLQTARAIEDEIRDAGYEIGEDPPVERVDCEKAEDLFRALGDAAKCLRDIERIPMVHLDGHGDRDNMRFPSGEMVSWGAIFAKLREINVLACNNVFMTCGACESAYALEGSEILDPTPVYALLAPAKQVRAGTIREGFRKFYRVLLETENGATALREFTEQHPDHFSILSSEHLFELSAARYIVNFCEGKARKQRQEDLVTRARRERPDLDIKEVRGKIKAALREDPMVSIERMFRQFLIVDRCPENGERFPFPTERIRKRAEQERLKSEFSRRTDVRG